MIIDIPGSALICAVAKELSDLVIGNDIKGDLQSGESYNRKPRIIDMLRVG